MNNNDLEEVANKIVKQGDMEIIRRVTRLVTFAVLILYVVLGGSIELLCIIAIAAPILIFDVWLSFNDKQEE